MKWLDSIAERSTRSLSRRTSRRSMLGSLGALFLGAAALPLLPVARGAKAAEGDSGSSPAGTNDPASCDYWRHCAIDGFLCTCCGGSQSTCPPGTEMSLVTWVGTCHNPADGKNYAISYNDCCGKSSCGRCLCNRNERDTPLYVPFQSNDYNWCSGSTKANIPYHCSTARIVGEAK
jgi:methylamine dehydrogenase light chain